MTDPNRDNVLSCFQTFRANGASISQVAAKINMLPALVARYAAELVVDGKMFDVTEPSSPVRRFRAERRKVVS